MIKSRESWHSSLASPLLTKARLAELELQAKHRFGQNFLVSEQVLRRIIELSELHPDEDVLEVGPGIGTLTEALLAHARCVYAIETDADLIQPLRDFFATEVERLQIVHKDALKLSPDELKGLPSRFIANLPYQVAATLLLRYFQLFASLKTATVMVQAEVADRICADPGTKIYGAYTAKLQLYARTAGRFEVGRHNFMPSPHVNSAVVHLCRREPDDAIECSLQEAGLSKAEVAAFIDTTFAQRRKTIRNSLKAGGYTGESIDEAFARCGFDPRRRAESFELADFIALRGAFEHVDVAKH